MPRRNNTGLIRKPGLAKTHPDPYIGAPPIIRPAQYTKLPLGGLFPLNLVMKRPAWCVVEECPDSSRIVHPNGRWTVKDKVKGHLQRHHEFDVLEDTGRQTFRVLCRSNTANVRSRGDGSFFVVGRENVDIPVPAALAGNYQAFAPMRLNRLVQPFQPFQAPQAQFFPAQVPQSVNQPVMPFQAPQSQFSPVQYNQDLNQVNQLPSTFDQPSITNDYQQDVDMNMGLFGDEGAGLDLGTLHNPIDLSYLDSSNQPVATTNDNGFGLRLSNLATSPEAVSHYNGLNTPLRQSEYNDQTASNSAFGPGLGNLVCSPQTVTNCGFNTPMRQFGYADQTANDNSFGLGVNPSISNQLAYSSHQNNLAFFYQSSPVNDNGFDQAMGECVFTEDAINRAAYELGFGTLVDHQASDVTQDNFNGRSDYTSSNIQPVDHFGQHAAGYVDNSPPSGPASFNNGTNFDQIHLIADYFDFDGTVVDDAAVLAALSVAVPIPHTDVEPVNQLPELQDNREEQATPQGEFIADQEDEQDEPDKEMHKAFYLLHADEGAASQESSQPAFTPTDGGFTYANASLHFRPIGSSPSPDMQQGTADAPTDFDELFGDDSSTFHD